MGKPSKGTPADRRLKENQGQARASTGPRAMPRPASPGKSAQAPGRTKSAATPGVPPSMPQGLKSMAAPKPQARTKAADQAPKGGPAMDMAFTLRAMPRKGG